MTGKELVEWIEKNHAEEYVVMMVNPEHEYMDVNGVWEGEAHGGAIMLDCTVCEGKLTDEEN